VKLVTCEITGISALLQNRFSETAEDDGGTRKVLVTHGTPREQAEKACYRLPNKQLYMPGTYIARMLREAGGGHKMKGSRKSAKWVVPAAVLVTEDTIGLHNGKAIKDFEVDSRPVTIPSTKGRIMRHRPRLDEWRATFHLEIDDTILPVDFIQQLMTEGGRQQGVGDFRPNSGGPFGRFMVTKWEEEDLKV
jgi:hypothetical protein